MEKYTNQELLEVLPPSISETKENVEQIAALTTERIQLFEN